MGHGGEGTRGAARLARLRPMRLRDRRVFCGCHEEPVCKCSPRETCVFVALTQAHPGASATYIRDTKRVLTRTDLDKSPGQGSKNVVVVVVEVAGIEPASFGFSPGILRAQPLTFVSRRLANGTGRRPYLAEISLAVG